MWALGSISFLAVYREVFETVLFYQTLWIEAGAEGTWRWARGFAAAAVGLGAAGLAHPEAGRAAAARLVLRLGARS